MPNGPIISPLRYPGGKSAIADKMRRIIHANMPNQQCTYIEPFSGGAGIALYLAMNGHVQRSVINDLDRSIYAFWHSVMNHTEDLIRIISDRPVNYDSWLECKEIHNNRDTADLLSLGAATFFLNRTNHSGIIKGGPLGGKNQLGTTAMDCRFNKKDLVRRIEKIAENKDRFEVYNLDVLELIDHIVVPARNDAFVYYDPPYYHKADALYENHLLHDDHVTLKNKVSSISHRWVMSYDDCHEIRDIYSDHHTSDLYLNYSAAEKRRGREILIWPTTTIVL